MSADESTTMHAPASAATGVPQENIQVCFRVRPLDKRERAAGEPCAWEIDTRTHTLVRRSDSVRASGVVGNNGAASVRDSQQLSFPCSTLFDQEASTEQLYDVRCRDIVESAMRGVNGSVLVYGQTSSGKTHTMKGSPSALGVIPLAMRHVFQHIRACRDHEFLLRMSYIEIYNEHVKDLLNTSSGDLAIHESKARGVHVQSLERIVRSEAEVLQWMEVGEGARHYGRTAMNDLSSRSHTILRLMIESNPISDAAAAQADAEVATFRLASPRSKRKAQQGKPRVKVSLLNFVDLAGSERLAQTNARVGGAIQKEGSFINKSLMFLGVIISRLSEGDKLAHLPFRDSKLTRILQSSLGGNARTSIICTVSPAASNVEQTVSTLRFGARAIQVQNHAQVNEISLESALINQEKIKIRELQARLSVINTGHAQEQEQEQENDMRDAEERMAQLEREQRTEQQVQSLQAEIANLQSFIHRPLTLSSAPNEPAQRRRHTLGATPAKSRGALRRSGEARSNAAAAALADDSGAFRAEQLACAQGKIAEFETLLSELSAENAELTQIRDDVLARCETLACDVESLQAERGDLKRRVDEYEGQAGALADLPAAALRDLRERMSAGLERVQRAMFFAEFAESHADIVAQAAAAAKAAAKAQTDAAEAQLIIAAAAAVKEAERNPAPVAVAAAVPDPMVEELKQQLEESRASAAALALALEASKAAAEEAEQRLAEEAEAENEKKAQAAAAHAHQVSRLQETCSALSAQAHKYAKEIMQLRGGEAAVANGHTAAAAIARAAESAALPAAPASTIPFGLMSTMLIPPALMATPLPTPPASGASTPAAREWAQPLFQSQSQSQLAQTLSAVQPPTQGQSQLAAPAAMQGLGRPLGDILLQSAAASNAQAIAAAAGAMPPPLAKETPTTVVAAAAAPATSLKKPSRLTSIINSGRKMQHEKI